MEKVTKKSIIDRCDKIRKSVEINTPIVGDDLDFLISVFKKHESWDQKSESGVKYVWVENTLYGNRCFYLIRNDKKRIDISPKQCLSPDSKLTRVKKACRNAIYPEVKKVKDGVNFGVDRCEFTGEILYTDNTHIDHYNLTFGELFNEWIKGKNVDSLNEKINKENGKFPPLRYKYDHKKNGVMVYFTDEDIISDFVEFHNKNTNLRAVSKTANLTLL